MGYWRGRKHPTRWTPRRAYRRGKGAVEAAYQRGLRIGKRTKSRLTGRGRFASRFRRRYNRYGGGY